MGELAQAMKVMGKLGLHVIKFPSGKYGFVGSVPVDLAYSGDPERVEMAMKFGPGLFKDVHRRVWDTEEDARKEALELGYSL